MQILRSKLYITSLQEILDFIAQDNLNIALKFKKELDEKINNLDFMPYKFRKSIYFDDESIRDLVFKGYCIAYKIYEKEDYILILNIKKYKL